MNNTTNSTLPAQINAIHSSNSIEEESVDIGQYWRVIKRHKFSIFSITLICLIIGVLAAMSAIPIYKAETKLIADPVQPNLDTRDQYVNSALVFLFYETQYEIIGSRNIAQKAVDKLDLIARHKTEQAAQTNPTEEETGHFIQQAKDYIQQAKTWLSSNNTPESMPEPSNEALRVNLASRIQGKLNISGGKQSQIISISYEDPDPQLAADITNAIAEAYVEFGLESRLSGAKKTSTWLNHQLSELKTKLKESEDSLQTFQKSQSMIDTGQEAHLAGTRLSTLSTELIRAQTKRSETEIRHNQIRDKHKLGDYASLSPILNNRAVQILEQETTKLSRSVQELAERYGEKHPKMIAARADLSEAKRNLETEIDKVVASVNKEYQAALNQENELSALIIKEKADLGAIKGHSFELTRLEREVLNNQKLYDSFLNRFQESNVSEQYDVSNVHIIDTAQVPAEPFKPNKPRFVIIALVLGLFIGILFAFLREHLNNTFKTTEDLEEKLKIASLGVIPVVKGGKKSTPPERQVLSDSRSQFTENVNNIRTGLLFSNIDNPPKTILVTSATATEGKSTLAANLAASLSYLNRTLLLEIDLRKSTVAKNMGIKQIPGLTDQVLSTESILEEAITKIGDEDSKLYAMPAGSFSPNPLELLSSDCFKNLLKELEKTFTYIVLDGPPVLAVSDAIVVGQLVDSVVVAAKAESTKVQMTKEAINRLQKANIKITGTVLCQADSKRMSDYGSHYYHYQDTSYYGNPAKAKP